jgi:hypothetical protein
MSNYLAPKGSEEEASGSDFYNIYEIIASLMYIHQPISEILQLDPYDALVYLKAYGKITKPKKH